MCRCHRSGFPAALVWVCTSDNYPFRILCKVATGSLGVTRSVTRMAIDLARVRRIGANLHICIPVDIERELVWNHGERVALRVAGEKLIVERIAMEKLALIRTGEVNATR